MLPAERSVLLVTGAAGFIGSHFVDLALAKTNWRIVALDKLTYAGSMENLAGVDPAHCEFVQGDICDAELVEWVFASHDVSAVVNFAAESHVDRSIDDAAPFVRTNVTGVQVLLDAARRAWLAPAARGGAGGGGGCARDAASCASGLAHRFVQVSTDEVYGSLAQDAAPWQEDAPLNPSSPYAASKAAADLLALSYRKTYGLPVCVTRGSNTYGPRQHGEKLIPTIAASALRGEPVPLYGDGSNMRDWMHVSDHCRAILSVLAHGAVGEVYNVGGGCEMANNELAERVMRLARADGGRIEHVEDRPGHDVRYAMDCGKAQRELGWAPQVSIDAGLAETVAWYKSQLGGADLS